MGYTVHGILQPRTLEWLAVPFSRDLPNSAIKPRSPTSQADSLPAKPPGEPRNTGVGGLSLLQWIFLTQESIQGLLLCRQILYQLSYQVILYCINKETQISQLFLKLYINTKSFLLTLWLLYLCKLDSEKGLMGFTRC